MRATPRTTARPHRNAARSGLLLMGIIAAGCQAGGQPEATTLRPTAAAQTGTIATSPASSSAPAPSSAGTVLPVGALNPDVTQSNIATTICVRGWTATVRPPETYTTTLKVRQLAALAYADQNPADYEEDHIIPLELGGAPHDDANLRPEAWPAAHTKDKEEDRLRAAVCSGALTLDAGRQEMARYAATEQGLPANG